MSVKRSIAVLGFLCTLQGIPSAAFAVTFLPAESYDKAVVALQNAGVIDGTRSGDVRLNDGVNRAEALKIILKAQSKFAPDLARVAANMPKLSLFSDVNQKDWYAPYVELGFRYKFITGYPDGTFWPEGSVTVEEAAAMLARSFGSTAMQVSFQTSADLPNIQNQWYSNAISTLIQKNAVMPGSKLKVGEALTRGQLFDLVYRMRLASSGTPLPPNVNPDLQITTLPDTNIGQYLSKKPFAITIPGIGITDLTITHPADPFSADGILEPLQTGVGHLFSYPGEGSNILVYGHSSGYPWDLSQYTKIFRTINKLKVGHRIYVTYKGKLYVYEVTSAETISAKDQSMFEQESEKEELVLYTCWPPDSITNRLLVHAKPVK